MQYFRALTALSLSAVVASAEYYEGDGTAYTLSDVSSGNCNFMSAISTASTNYAAINNDQWDDLANCGRCAEVSCIDDDCADQNTTAIVQILDRCPECSEGDLDLSPTVFETITGSDPSRLTIRWQFVECPDPGTVEVCLKTGSNGYYVAVQPTNTLVGVESVTINGEATTMVDSAYYFLIESTSEVDLTAVEVSITSIDGEVIDGSYSLTAGECTDTGSQFSSSSSSSTTSSGSSGTSAQQTTAPATTTTAPSTSQTDAPAATTATPTATTSAPDTQSDSTGDEADSYSSEGDESSTSTTTAPTATTATPEATTAIPESTTAAPEATTAAPKATTSAPVSSTDDTSKCHVRGRRRRD